MLSSKPALETALNHRSVRKFTSEPIAPEVLSALLNAGQMASTSSFLQSVSVIRITDPQQRAKIRAIAAGGVPKGHHYVESCAEFLVYCIDNHRHRQLMPNIQTDWVEVLMIGAIDVALFAQNVLLTAESLGLGGVYIGGIRNDIAAVSEILAIPQDVVPLLGMCLGYPDHEPAQRPRLPAAAMVSENTYQVADAALLAQYDQTVAEYYKGIRNLDLNWVQQIDDTLNMPSRPEMLAYLNQQGFAKR